MMTQDTTFDALSKQDASSLRLYYSCNASDLYVSSKENEVLPVNSIRDSKRETLNQVLDGSSRPRCRLHNSKNERLSRYRFTILSDEVKCIRQSFQKSSCRLLISAGCPQSTTRGERYTATMDRHCQSLH
jgi:hypothetical protein